MWKWNNISNEHNIDSHKIKILNLNDKRTHQNKNPSTITYLKVSPESLL